MRQWFKIIVLQMVALQIACVTTQPSINPEKTAEFENIVNAALKFSEQESEPIAGLSLAVYSKGQPIFVKGFGLADDKKKIPVTKDTIFRIGSITKQFTAVGIMTLVEDKKISLSDSVRSLLPEYKQIPQNITVEHLLAHTSGIVNYTSLPNWPDLENRAIPRADFVRIFLEKPLEFKPGSDWQYSNSNYYLLGLIIEKVSGMSYASFLEQRLMKKAKLRHITYCSPSMDSPDSAKGYVIDKNQWVEAPPLNIDHPYSAGALCSTAEDLALWATALMRGEIISLKSLQQMTTPVPQKKKIPNSQIDVGWAFTMFHEMGHRFVGSGGAINGFSNTLDTYPDDELVVVALSNTDPLTSTMISTTLARSALGLIQDLPVQESLGKDLEGFYQSSNQEAGFQLTWKQGQIFYTRTEKGNLAGPTTRVRAQGNDTFIINETSAFITLQKTKGKPTGASYFSFGSEQKLLKSL